MRQLLHDDYRQDAGHIADVAALDAGYVNSKNPDPAPPIVTAVFDVRSFISSAATKQSSSEKQPSLIASAQAFSSSVSEFNVSGGPSRGVDDDITALLLSASLDGLLSPLLSMGLPALLTYKEPVDATVAPAEPRNR
jgi:hypothetical protein